MDDVTEYILRYLLVEQFIIMQLRGIRWKALK